jgi:NADPH:quinone reductase-like Zn-dependent oxidoreductase
MKALIFKKAGQPENVLEFENVEVPQLKNDEVLVKVLASPINPSDFMFINDTYRFKPQFPQIAGMEATGIIEAVGKSTEFKVGMHVSFFFQSAWAEYVAVKTEKLLLIPEKFPLEKAAQLALNAMTAWGLMESAMIPDDGWLLVTAGNSSVSKLILQFASYRRLKVIAAVRDKRPVTDVSRYTDYVLDINSPGIAEHILTITNGKGINALIDPVGGPAVTEVIKSLAQKAKVVIYGALSKEPIQFENSDFVYKDIAVRGFGILSYYQTKNSTELRRITQELVRILGHSKFRMDIAGTFDLAQFKEALEKVKQSPTGKVLFVPGDGSNIIV